MEYAEFIDINPEHKLNDSFTRYSGYQDTSTLLQTNFFNINTVNKISKKSQNFYMGLIHKIDLLLSQIQQLPTLWILFIWNLDQKLVIFSLDILCHLV